MIATTQWERACSLEVRTPRMTRVVVLAVWVYFAFLASDFERRAFLTAACSAVACERLTVIRRSRTVLRPPLSGRAAEVTSLACGTASAAGSAAASNAAADGALTFGASGAPSG